MTINVAPYPSSNRVPGFWAVLDPSKANTAQIQMRGLVIGQGETGKVTSPLSGVPVISGGQADARLRYGARSPLAIMVGDYRLNDPTGELWCLPFADPAGAAAATGTIAFTGTATGAATPAFYIGAGTLSERVPFPISVGDTATAVAAALAAAINAAVLPVTAVATAGSVALTATGKGTWGNEIPIVLNFGGTAAGEAEAAGIVTTITPMASGTGVPLLPAGLANLGDTTFDFIICPYTDSVSLSALDAFLDETSGRWSWSIMLFGGYFCAFRGTFGERVTFGTGRNARFGSCLGFNGSPTPYWRWAAAYAGVCAASLRADPALPLQNIAINGVLAPKTADRDEFSERNTLLYDGISTFKVANDGTVLLERSVTFFQKNAAGAPDDSYLDVETGYTLALLIRDMRAYLASVYPRVKLVVDGTDISGGSRMVSSATILATAVSRYRAYCNNGYAQDFDGFKSEAGAENAGNGLVKLYLPFRLANQLRSVVMVVAFTKP